MFTPANKVKHTEPTIELLQVNLKISFSLAVFRVIVVVEALR